MAILARKTWTLSCENKDRTFEIELAHVVWSKALHEVLFDGAARGHNCVNLHRKTRNIVTRLIMYGTATSR